MEKPIVSVVMITYGHEKYIKQAIEGVLMQECDFEVELIVANDNSPDGTDFVVKDILEKHPNSGWIKYTCHKENKGMMSNFGWALQQCKGKYLALCEGDDYWVDNLKLQKQFDFLERNSIFSLVFTNRIISRHNKNREEYFSKSSYSYEDIVGGFIPPTQTYFFRNIKGLSEMILRNDNYPSGDRLVALFLSQYGEIYKMEDITAVYNDSSYGVWSKFQKDQKGIISLKRLLLFYKDLKSGAILDVKKDITFEVLYRNIILRIIGTFKEGAITPGVKMIFVAKRNIGTRILIGSFLQILRDRYLNSNFSKSNRS